MSFYLSTIQAIWWATVRRVAHPTLTIMTLITEPPLAVEPRQQFYLQEYIL